MPGRVFVAIELPAAARDLLARSTAAFVEADPEWAREKLVAPCLLHVTLAFLGAVADGDLDGLMGRIGEATASLPPFDVRVSGLRAVPSTRRASMMWATLEGDLSAAARLAGAVAAAAGLPESGRAFRPHVTLARARRPRPVAPEAVAAAMVPISASGKDPVGSVSVRSVTVFSSTTGHGGPAYEPLGQLRLAGAFRGPGSD